MRISPFKCLLLNPLDLLGWLSKRPEMVILIILLFHTANTAAFVILDKMPLFGDEAVYFQSSGAYLEALKSGLWTLYSSLQGPWPPLHRILSLPFYLIFGYSPDIAVLSMLPASFVLILSVYLIGKNLQGTEAGLLAACLTVLLPGIFSISRSFLIESTLAAAVALSLALMLKTEWFSHRGYTFAFGASLALGALTKWTFSVFLIGPFLVYAHRSYREACRSGEKARAECSVRGAWLLLSVVFGLLLAALWYVPHRGEIQGPLSIITREWDIGREIIGSDNVLLYLKALYTMQLRPLFLALALASAACLFIKRKSVAVFLTAWFIVPWFFFTFIVLQNKAEIFVTSYLPAFPLLIAIGAVTLPQKLKRAVVSLVLIAGIAQLMAITYGGEPLPVDEWAHQGSPRFDHQDWRLGEITSGINALLAGQQGAHAVVINHDVYTVSVLKYLQQMGLLVPFEAYDVGPCVVGGQDCGRSYEFYEELFESVDVVLMGEHGGRAIPTSLARKDYSFIQAAWDATSGLFEPVSQITLHDGERLVLYAKRGLARVDLTIEMPEWAVGPEDRLSKKLKGGDTSRLSEDEGIYFDENSKSHVLRMGREARFLIPLVEGAEPTDLVLQYSAYRPEGFENPRFSVFIDGQPVANVSEEPPYPWTVLRIPLPDGREHDGALDILIESNTYVDENGEERGIALDWLTVACDADRGCIKGWNLQWRPQHPARGPRNPP